MQRTEQILLGDCRDILPTLAEHSVSACITDPPYNYEFVGHKWDANEITRRTRRARANGSKTLVKNIPYGSGLAGGVRNERWYERNRENILEYQNWCLQWGKQVFRVLKPGGIVAVFNSTRTVAHVQVALEAAGFYARDCIVYRRPSGIPKGLNLSAKLKQKNHADFDTWRGWHSCLRNEWKTMPMTKPTAPANDEDVEAILAQLTEGLRSILGDGLVGIYLYGSLVTGDFDPHISDIDLAVVLNEELDSAGFEQLHRLHQGIVKRQPEWHDRLELAYISQLALKTFRRQSSKIGIISPGEPFHIIKAGADWLISWYALRQDGIALAGPPIQSLFDDISTDEYLQAVGEHICGYRDSVKQPQNKQALSYIVLTVARGFYTLAHGAPTSKALAAAWAKRRYPHWAELIEGAWSWRADPQSDSLSTEQIRPKVETYVSDMLSKLPDLDFSCADREQP